jgi:arylsulfatase A-like enzyme
MLFLRVSLAGLAVLVLSSVSLRAQDRAAKTNVVLILADDLGSGDLACYDGWCRTPNIDALASQGARFTQAYAAASVGTPSRAGIFTGRHPARLGVQANVGTNQVARKRARGLPGEVVTLAERLEPLGYHTGLIGKWFLGMRDGMTPLDQGFDEFFGFLGGSHAYLPGTTDSKMVRGSAPEAEHEPEYLTEAFTREAEAFLERNKAQPFLLCVSFNAPHTPLEASAEHLQRFPDLKGPKQTYAAMVSVLDDGVGRILAALEQHGLAERTLVVFTSDNGAPIEEGPGKNKPLAHGKGYVFEGGNRVPLLLRWPGRVTPGKRIEAPVSLLDLAPTTLALAGAPPEALAELDGIDLATLLASPDGSPDGAAVPERAFFWKLGSSAAIRKGDWKLVTSKGSRWLFDLSKDPSEGTDLADEELERKQALAQELESWIAKLPEPLWKNEADGTGLKVLGKTYWVEF